MLILGKVRLSKGKICHAGLESPASAINRKKHLPSPYYLSPTILDPAFNRFAFEHKKLKCELY